MGFEGYTVDFRRGRSIYYLPDGESIELPLHELGMGLSAAFDAGAVQSAIREAQTKAPACSYAVFCRQVMGAGCAGCTVSFSGRRAVYSGRTAEAYVELFPD